MEKWLKKLYVFLFMEHEIGFIRFCYAMLIPCAFSVTFCRWWLLWMAFIVAVVTEANHKGWNRRTDNG